MVAYCLYKKNKRNFITKYKKDKNKNPTQKELESYVASAETHLESYKNQAETFLSSLFNNILDEKQVEIENIVLKKYVNAHNSSFWYSIFTNLVASFIWAILLVIMFFVAQDYSFEQIARDYFKIPAPVTQADSTILKK
jgi:hypothetical protein